MSHINHFTRKLRGPHLGHGQTRSFTLIELLVVVAIIAILAALLLPVLKGAKKRAEIAVCIGNLKQISAGFFLYNNDWDGYYPYGCDNTGPYYEYLWTQLDPYLQCKTVLDPYYTPIVHCPSTDPNTYKFWGDGTNSESKYDDGYGYPIGASASAFDGGWGYYACGDLFRRRKIAQIRTPSKKILICDKGSASGSYLIDWWPPNIEMYMVEAGGYRHFGTANVAFADGRVGGLRYEDISDDATAPTELMKVTEP